jgi:hypothetical protein
MSIRVARLAVLVCTLAALAVSSDAADAGRSTMAAWFVMSPAARNTFVLGSIDMLGALGLACPANLTIQDVNNSLQTGLAVGEIKSEANLGGTILASLLGKGCRFTQGGLILRALADHMSSGEP